MPPYRSPQREKKAQIPVSRQFERLSKGHKFVFWLYAANIKTEGLLGCSPTKDGTRGGLGSRQHFTAWEPWLKEVDIKTLDQFYAIAKRIVGNLPFLAFEEGK